MNLLLNSIFKVKNKSNYWYKLMRKLSEQSYKKNLKYLDKIYTILGSNEFENANAAYKMVYYKIKDIWKEGHNILFVDVDTLCVKPTVIFEKFHDFAMFWKTDKEVPEFNPYFACGIRYYPRNLADYVWRQGEQAWEFYEKKEPHRFDNEQMVYNSMLYIQEAHPNFFLRNRLHFIKGFDNHIEEKKANIIHFPATKGMKEAYNEMKIRAKEII